MPGEKLKQHLLSRIKLVGYYLPLEIDCLLRERLPTTDKLRELEANNEETIWTIHLDEQLIKIMILQLCFTFI